MKSGGAGSLGRTRLRSNSLLNREIYREFRNFCSEFTADPKLMYHKTRGLLDLALEIYQAIFLGKQGSNCVEQRI
jgi:hypothetical protein